MNEQSTQERFKRGSAEAGRFFRYMADFVGFTAEDAAAIRDSRFVIEAHIPTIVAAFYTQLLRFPATRQPFLKKDGTIDRDNLELRMHHQTHFWRRAASGDYDDDFARYVDYVGRAHTSQGADPKIYIPERYVIGMVGFMQQQITAALAKELREIDPELESRAARGWGLLMMVILEMLARSYSQEKEPEIAGELRPIDGAEVHKLAIEAYEKSLGVARSIEYREVLVGRVDEIPDGQRKLIQVDDLSIGVFHHQGGWYALHNSCLHRGGPVCTGPLEGNTLTCPWHGYQYNVTDGVLLLDRNARLPMYPVEIRGDEVYVRIPFFLRDEFEINLDGPLAGAPLAPGAAPGLAENEFPVDEVPPGTVIRLFFQGEPVAVYNVDGAFYATHERCTHVGGPLSEGRLNGEEIICPWHDSCFNVITGAVTCGPAKKPVRTYRVVVENGIGRIEE